MQKAAIHIYLIFTLFLSVTLSTAQIPSSYRFELLDVNDGLSHGQVNCILKDKRGYIWIGTATGLNVYNGYSVTTYRYDPRDSTSINANDISAIYEDPEGNIWVNTFQGLNVFDPVKETFNHNIPDYSRKYNLPSGNVSGIIHDNDSIYWFIIEEHGIVRYDLHANSTINFNAKSEDHRLSSNDVSTLALNNEGDVWVLHTNGMLERINGKTLENSERHGDIFANFRNQDITYKLMVDSDNDLWIYLPFNSQGVFFYDIKADRLVNYNKSSFPIRLNNDLVRGVVEDSNGLIWVGTDHGGIDVINKKDSSITYILHNPEIKNSLAHNTIYCLYKDDNNIIWVGTYKNGINYYHSNIKRFEHYKHLLSDPGTLPYDDLNRFVEDDKGNIWIGTNGGGLLYFDRTNNSFNQYRVDPTNPDGISSDVIVSLLIDNNNTLWVGTYFGGLNRFDGKKFKHYRNDPEDSTTIADDNIWELFEDSEHHLWIGTLSHGIDRFDKQTGTFEHYASDTIEAEGNLHTNYILSIEEDDQGNIWIGGGSGVDILNRQTGKVEQLVNDPDDPSSLVSNTVVCLHKDNAGRMWIGTQEGLHVYTQEKGLFRLFTTNDGLPHNTILTILEDDNHNLWFSTPNGLSNLIFDRSSDSLMVSFVNYDESDGLQGKVFNENAALKTSKGKLIFGGANGFNIFDPEHLSTNNKIPEIVFTDFQLFNKSIQVGEARNGRIILPQSLLYTNEVTLNYDEDVFSIEFAALNFLHPGKNKYKYKLEGFDDHWLSGDQTRKVTYTNLDPGHYRFRVIASNNDGVWNEEGIVLNIEVLPPFWKTNWAYAIYIFTLLLLIYLGRRVVLHRERIKFQIEQERREAKQMHEFDLLKIRFFTNVSHEFRTPLSLILAPLNKLIQHTRDSDQMKQFQMIHRNARRLLNLVNQLLDFRKIEVDSIDLYTSDGNIIKFIEESVHSFSDLSENNNITLGFKTDKDELYASFDMDKLEKILFNLLSNAFKFTPENGHIDVEVGCQSGLQKTIIVIKVRDTGIGIPKEQQARIFERFFRNNTPGSVVNQGSGIGLSITSEFVKIHGGTIKVESEPEKGTCFIVKIPVEEIVMHEPAAKPAITGFYTIKDSPPKRHHNDATPTILLVEDNEDFRFYLKDNLGVHFKVIEARNGKEAWQKALSTLPDLIVSDLMMPELNGIDLCKKIKDDTRTSHIPFVLLTAHTADDKKLKGLDIGADDYVTKPFNFEILLSRIKNLIHQRKAMREVFKKKISVETTEIDITSLDDKLIQNAMKVVEENISNPDFSVELLSRELGMSRVHLYKKMVSLTGKTPVEFIRKIRLQRAAQFLKKSQLTVAEVAYKVGFNNRKYFTKYFKMEFNVLPSVYANKAEE